MTTHSRKGNIINKLHQFFLPCLSFSPGPMCLSFSASSPNFEHSVRFKRALDNASGGFKIKKARLPSQMKLYLSDWFVLCQVICGHVPPFFLSFFFFLRVPGGIPLWTQPHGKSYAFFPLFWLPLFPFTLVLNFFQLGLLCLSYFFAFSLFGLFYYFVSDECGLIMTSFQDGFYFSYVWLFFSSTNALCSSEPDGSSIALACPLLCLVRCVWLWLLSFPPFLLFFSSSSSLALRR